MSASVMGAVMTSGPARLRLRLALVGIAYNADDFGFAQLSIATIASKSVCNQRTAMRVVKALEREGWLKVYRRVVEGKGSVYIIDIAKLGVVPDAKSRKSQWHTAFERGMRLRCEQEKAVSSGDKMSPEPGRERGPEGKSLTLKRLRELSAQGAKSGDKMSPENASSPFLPSESGDISQGVQVTFCPDSGDISDLPLIKNHRTIRTIKTPPTPLAGGERAISSIEDARFEAQERGYWQVRNRLQEREGRKPIPWEAWIADARRRRPQTAPEPAKTDAEFEACETAEDAARLVMARTGIGARRLLPVIAGAIGRHAAQARLPVAEVGYLAWSSYREYAACCGSMRYSYGPRRFFEEPHWLNPGGWPVEKLKPTRL